MSAQQYLFLFTIGSPQAFIAQARKTHDLFAGSKIISDLIDAAMVVVGKNNVIFPDANSDAKPNRFLAKIPADILPDGNINAFCESIETATRKAWILIALEAYQNAKLINGKAVIDKSLLDMLPIESCQDVLARISKIAEKQLILFPEIFWVALPFNNDYKAKHDELITLLGGIKNTRKFCQLHEPAGRKCSLDGERNALYFRADDNGDKPAFMDWDKGSSNRQIHEITDLEAFKLNPKEALSAVSLVKRFYKSKEYSGENAFPSTAKIALMHALGEIDVSNDKKNTFQKYKRIFGKSFDEQLCYEENLTKDYFEKNGIANDLLPEAIDSHNELKKSFEIKKVSLQKYYGIIVFDGDSFGKLWSGEGLEDEQQLERFQIELARNLHTFAREANKILSYPKGITVYAGGDDFLGFVNLNHLFKVMSELRIAYTNLIETPIIKEFNNSFTRSITFTAGVAIAHYKEPLSVVLGEARAAEKAAKKAFENDDKDAFSLSVLKHSGESLRCFYKWKYNDLQLTDVLGSVVTKLQDANNGFSNTFIKNIDQEFRPLMNENGEYSGGTLHVLSELNRLITRSSKTGKDNPEIGELQESIKHIYDSNCRYNKSLENFLVSLHICDFITRKTSDE
ncbi:MAG: type III-B CRISPR-associated protein Cas10/Cmr2 [Bacteroidales bacterium]|nr:type III-B CRISPR-associated protein Cas10/Cmr2 [Bacteroidales bacterium]NTV18039.1 type III-B CRISPR-associated protein Cas10/Cmr2 [Bacteroidales bacterium]